MFKNLTPHAICVRDSEGVIHTFQPDPQGPARVSVRTETLPAIAGFRLQAQAFGQVYAGFSMPTPPSGHRRCERRRTCAQVERRGRHVLRLQRI